MFRAVKCPKCGEVIQTSGNLYFRHCKMSFDVNSCILTDTEAVRYRKNAKKNDEIQLKNEEFDDYDKFRKSKIDIKR